MMPIVPLPSVSCWFTRYERTVVVATGFDLPVDIGGGDDFSFLARLNVFSDWQAVRDFQPITRQGVIREVSWCTTRRPCHRAMVSR